MAASLVASTTRRKDKIGQVSTTTNPTTRQKDKIASVLLLGLCLFPVLALEYLYIICITYVHVAIALVEVITIGFKICCKSFKNGVWRSWAWICVPLHIPVIQYVHALLVLSTQIRSACGHWSQSAFTTLPPCPQLCPVDSTSQLLVASY